MRHHAAQLTWVLLAGLLGVCPAGLVQAQSPAVELPAMPAASDLPVLPPSPLPENATTAPVAAPADAPATEANAATPDLTAENGFTPSYGRFQYSLFFTPEEIARMKKVLDLVDSQRGQSTPDIQANDDFNQLLEQAVTAPVEPQPYPNFHLSSLTYKGPDTWVFWLNDKKYTPKKLPPDMTVLAISSRSVTLAWTPSFINAAYTRWSAKEMDQSIPKNRLAHPMADVTYQSSPPGFVFTLAPNQSYVGGAFAVYEGKHEEKTLSPMSNATLQGVTPVGEMSGSTPPSTPEPDAELNQTMGQQQQFIDNLKTLAPRNSAAQAPSPNNAPMPVQAPPILMPSPTMPATPTVP
jgi:hypothetical protein